MKDLFDPAVVAEITERLEKLQPDSPRYWGKMDPAQMLSHCAAVLELAVGDKKPPRMLFGRLFGPIAKRKLLDEKPFARNYPTAPDFVRSDPRDFAKEKAHLLELLTRFSRNGPGKASTHPHPFFGPLKPREWSLSTWKHLDHHLRQFGV